MTAIEQGRTEAQNEEPQAPKAAPHHYDQANQDVNGLIAQVQTQVLHSALVDARAEIHRLGEELQVAYARIDALSQNQKPERKKPADRRPAKKSTAKKTTAKKTTEPPV